MRYWCISTSPDNWEICRKNSVWGMDARYYVTLKKFLESGDKAVVYTHGGKFVAVAEFVGKHYFSEEDIGWTKGKRRFLFPYRINLRIIHESKNPPRISFSTKEIEDKAKWIKPNFIDDIVFIADKGGTWNQYVQVSIIRITEEDFNTICKAVMKS
ncbi:MAG: EVE domain-containing protein [Candidatus Bathyarchaeota archaeon]|nr:EVE domain-containing protein [Candidatus Bathyarchaeota archaeon]